jgi:RHS repeat-associated protein
LGNIRLSYTEDPSSHVLKIIEENHYYPFGLKHTNYNSDVKMYTRENPITGLFDVNGTLMIKPVSPLLKSSYNYKYQGQERQDELGLNWDSFKYRNYDYAIGRFMSIDPLAEKYPYNSTYAFQENKMGMGRELEGLELGGAEFNKYAAELGKSVTGVLDNIQAAFTISHEHEIVPNTLSVVSSSTTTYNGNFTSYAMSSQYPNFGDSNLFNKPKVENKTQVQATAKATVVVEGVSVTASHTESKDVKTGKQESESKVVVGSGDNGVFVSKTKTDGAKTETRAGVQAEASVPVSTNDKVKFSASISIGK